MGISKKMKFFASGVAKGLTSFASRRAFNVLTKAPRRMRTTLQFHSAGMLPQNFKSLLVTYSESLLVDPAFMSLLTMGILSPEELETALRCQICMKTAQKD
eukprot:TRINITY_DN2899_c0_g1_i2.p1 TRINITY_DN2899_c0_g1~~TRINITY_DN2899_c0_g1_i2.p1  ORF type:complete len:101 (+),score=11.34 TRINITY_DN2899_c0_g1_i2:40-342(+)